MRTEKDMLAALAGGAIIKALPDKHLKPWIDFRGNAWSNAEVKQMKKLKIANDVPTVNISPEGIKKLNKLGSQK